MKLSSADLKNLKQITISNNYFQCFLLTCYIFECTTDDKGNPEEGQSILYAIHSKTDNEDVTITKYTWDSDTMRYIASNLNSKRAVSAPAMTSNTSTHLQKLFRAAQESEEVNGRSPIPKRSQTAKGLFNRKWLVNTIHSAFIYVD